MKLIVWETPDGTIAVSKVHVPVDEDMTEDEFLDFAAEYFKSTHADHSAYTRLPNIETTDLPQSRKFRICWRNDGNGKPKTDLPLARTQRLEEIRLQRNQKLLDSDGPMAREREQNGNNQNAMKVYRQLLRDLPVAVEAELGELSTDTELEDYQPDWPVE